MALLSVSLSAESLAVDNVEMSVIPLYAYNAHLDFTKVSKINASLVNLHVKTVLLFLISLQLEQPLFGDKKWPIFSLTVLLSQLQMAPSLFLHMLFKLLIHQIILMLQQLTVGIKPIIYIVPFYH